MESRSNRVDVDEKAAECRTVAQNFILLYRRVALVWLLCFSRVVRIHHASQIANLRYSHKCPVIAKGKSEFN
mgnify:CR=1 FL=1